MQLRADLGTFSYIIREYKKLDRLSKLEETNISDKFFDLISGLISRAPSPKPQVDNEIISIGEHNKLDLEWLELEETNITLISGAPRTKPQVDTEIISIGEPSKLEDRLGIISDKVHFFAQKGWS